MSTTQELLKLIADNSVGYLNKASRFPIENMTLQHRNLFEILLYPKDLESGLSVTGAALAALDSLIARIYVSSITVPFLSLEYENFNELKGVKDVIYPEQCTITFLEDQLGTMRNYLNKWIKSIMFPFEEHDRISGTTQKNYIFVDDQEGAKKNAIIIPSMGLGLPSTGWIKIEGLKFKSMDDIVFGHGEGDPMQMTVSFSCDTVWWKTLF